MTTDTKAVESILTSSHAMLTVNDLRRTPGLDEPTVRAQLKALAQQGQIEHIPGRGRYDGKYGLLRTTPQPPAGVDSEGSEADVSAAPVQAPSVADVNVDEQIAMYKEICSRYDINDCPAGLAGHLSRSQEAQDRLRADVAAWQGVAEPFECYTPSGFAEFAADLSARAKANAEDAAELASVHDILAAELAPESDPRDPSDMETEDLARVVLGHLNAERSNAVALSTKLQTLLDSKTHECEALRAELANTRTDGEQAVDVLDAAHGYLVKAPKRKPRFLTQPDAARNAAMACARNGSGRGDVYALVHVGTAKRGAEWTEPN